MEIIINGQKFKHINTFRQSRNTLKSKLKRWKDKGNSNIIKLPQGYWVGEKEWDKLSNIKKHVKQNEKTNDKSST